MNVLLLHLPQARASYQGTLSIPEPLAQLFLAPALADHSLRFLDLRWTRNLERALGDFRPDVAAVGVGPLTYGAAGGVLAKLRALFPDLRVLLFADAEYGNAHVFERPLDFAHPLADVLVQPFFLARIRKVVPEAIAAWSNGRDPREVPGLLVQHRPGEWVVSPREPNVVGDIGVPDRALLGGLRGRYRFGGIGRMAHLFYTYGCKFKCRFCPMSKHDGSLAARSLDDVLRELSALTEPHVFLQDFEPFLAPQAMEALAREVERAGIAKRWFMLTRADTALAEEDLIRRWRKIGLRWLYLGLDGASPERLREIGKGSTMEVNELALRRMQALGLAVAVGFVVPSNATHEDFAALRALLRRLRPPLVDVTVETPLVGTRLFDEREAELTTRDWSLFDLGHAVLPTSMPLPEFYRELARLHLAAGLRSMPSIWRHLPLRDVLRISVQGGLALRGCRNAARDHGAAPSSGVQPRPHAAEPRLA